MTTQRVLFRYMDLPARKSRSKAEGPAEPHAEFPPLQVLVEQAWQRFPTVGDRHVPRLVAPTQAEDQANGAPQIPMPRDGVRYVVPIRRAIHRRSGAVILRICTYTQGEVSAFAPQALQEEEADINYTQVKDEQGRLLPPGIEFSVLLLGRVALIQNRAAAGAAKAVQCLIRQFGRAVCGNAFVMPKFLPVSPSDIKDQINAGGGIEAVSFGLAEVVREPGEGVHLGDVHSIEDRVGGSRTRVRISAESDETLDEEESLKLMEEPDADGIENVRLHLKDGVTLKGDRIALGKTISVGLANGVPSCEDVDRELLGYLNELMRPDSKNDQQVTREGRIGGKLAVLEIQAKRR